MYLVEQEVYEVSPNIDFMAEAYEANLALEEAYTGTVLEMCRVEYKALQENAITDAIKNLWEHIKEWFNKAKEWVVKIFRKAMVYFNSFVKNASNFFNKYNVEIARGLDKVENRKGLSQADGEKLIKKFKDNIDTIRNKIKDIKTFSKGIVTVADPTTNTVSVEKMKVTDNEQRDKIDAIYAELSKDLGDNVTITPDTSISTIVSGAIDKNITDLEYSNMGSLKKAIEYGSQLKEVSAMTSKEIENMKKDLLKEKEYNKCSILFKHAKKFVNMIIQLNSACIKVAKKVTSDAMAYAKAAALQGTHGKSDRYEESVFDVEMNSISLKEESTWDSYFDALDIE